MKKIKIRKLGENDEPYQRFKVPLKLSIYTLNSILAYIISDSESITRGNLMNVRKLFKIIDKRLYEQDYELIARFKFIQRALNAKLDEYIENPIVLLETSRSTKYAEVEDGIIEDVMNMELKSTDLKRVTNLVSDKLSYAFLYKYKEPLANLIMRLENGEYESFKDLKKEFKRNLSSLLTEIRKVENLEDSGTMFSLMDDMFESVVSKTVKQLQKDSNQLRFGIRALNEMTNGGAEAGRVYTILGLSGGFKSGCMLNLAYELRQANKRYKTKDPLKRPAILFITQENLVSETVDRLFSLAVAKDTKDRLKNYKIQDAIKLLKTKGRMKLTKENNIDIIIMYKPAGTIDTSDVLAEIENLEEEGIEIIALFHDYMKKIRSINPNKDLRLEMQNIVQEFKVIAVDKQIPVFLANQLNRDAKKTIDAAIECNKTDLARFLGSANVSESWGVIEESDCVFLINKERMVSTNQLYLSIKRLKIRYGSDDSIDYFNHPFLPNEFGLVEDISLENSVSIKSLSETLIGEKDEEEIEFGKRGESSGKKRKEKGRKKEKELLTLQNLESIFDHAA